MTEPLPANTGVIAPKVKWAALAGAVVSAVLTALVGAASNTDIVQGLPDWAAVLLAALAGGGFPGLAGYLAPHQDRYPPGNPNSGNLSTTATDEDYYGGEPL